MQSWESTSETGASLALGLPLKSTSFNIYRGYRRLIVLHLSDTENAMVGSLRGLALGLGGCLLPSALAATLSYDFKIEWVRANPDGLFERPTIGINGQWPIPRIDANVGDTIIINAHNALGNQTTSLHFHGLSMNGTTHMDGPSQVSQCPVPVGGSFVYAFTVGSL